MQHRSARFVGANAVICTIGLTSSTLCLLLGAFYATLMTTFSVGLTELLGSVGWGLTLIGALGTLTCLVALVLQWRVRRPRLTGLATLLLISHQFLLGLCLYVSLITVKHSEVLQTDYVLDVMATVQTTLLFGLAVICALMVIPLVCNLRLQPSRIVSA